MTTCPACSKNVDTLRSRFVGVVDGKIVAFCSSECIARLAPATAAASGPVAMPPALVAAQAAAAASAEMLTDQAPTPTILATAPGEAAKKPEAKPDAKSEVKAAKPEAKPAKADAKPEAKADAKPEAKAAKAETIEKPAAKADTKPEKADAKPDVKVAKAEAKVEKAEAKAAKRSGRIATVAGEKPPRARHPDEISMDKFWTADKEKAAAAAQAKSGRWRVIAIVLLLVAAAAAVAYVTLLRDSVAAATIPPPAIRAVAPKIEAPPAQPVVEPAAAVEQAVAALGADLAGNSPRVQRVAAAALARTKDPRAIEALAGWLGLAKAEAPGGELTDLARLDLAHALALAGDARGTTYLAAALRSARGELRDESARLLVLLDDPRGVPHLLDLLQISQRRLGAAEHLAHLAEPRAVKVLEQLRADPKTSADDKARATIALGNAGRADVGPALHAMLADPHFNAFAAAALAELKDPAARPILEHQLESPILRVGAARALRRLVPQLDARPLLPALLTALRADRDVDRAQTAEAILLLAGPATWSTLP